MKQITTLGEKIEEILNMKHISVVVALFCVVIVLGAETNDELYTRMDMITVANLTEYFEATKQNVALTPMKRSHSLARGQIRYTLGQRVNGEINQAPISTMKELKSTWTCWFFLGDRVVATNNGKRQWSSPQSVALTLYYPVSGTGAIVSFAEVTIDQVCTAIQSIQWAQSILPKMALLYSQSSNIGQAYVVDGGIGQRRLTVVVEAYNTVRLNHNASIYGYWRHHNGLINQLYTQTTHTFKIWINE